MIIDSPVYEKMCSALNNASLVSGIKQASPEAQTSCLEGFHSTLNQFAPKMIAFSYIGMYCRLVVHLILCIKKEETDSEWLKWKINCLDYKQSITYLQNSTIIDIECSPYDKDGPVMMKEIHPLQNWNARL